MLQTIGIFQESGKRNKGVYRAVRGQQQAEGKTPGQALDSLEKLLTTEEKIASSLVILQRFQADALFSTSQIERLQELMAQFQTSINDDKAFSLEEKAELEELIDAEWIAAIARGATILAQANQSETE
ncbi:MAG: hypothetical protein DWQ04_26075 [Chloroflexi bacterium]|nr:MAG: hypothetical protein DWQ04_26075 [Chloroflexota bacterium]